MKMTRLEWRYLQKVALDHPYFDTHELPLTEKEAKAIVEANIKMTGKEFVDSIYAKLGMTRPEEKKDRFAWLHNIGELFTVPPIRKIAIAVLVVLLMTVFFAATPTGRAIAESVIQYIVTLFDDGQLLVSQNENTTPLFLIDNKDKSDIGERQDNSTSFIYIKSFEEFTRNTGKTPVILPLQCTELYYEYDEMVDYIVLYSKYESPKGQIVTYQIWGVEDLVYGTLTEYEAFEDDKDIFYSIGEMDWIYCMKVFEDSVFHMSTKGNYALSELVGFLKDC